MSVDTPEDLAITEQWMIGRKFMIRVSQLPFPKRMAWHGLCRLFGRKVTVMAYKSTKPLFRYWVWRGRISVGRLL